MKTTTASFVWSVAAVLLFVIGACNAANISVTWSAPWSKLAMEISATCGDNLVFNAKGKVDVIQLKIPKCYAKKLATYPGRQGPIVIPVMDAGTTFFTSGKKRCGKGALLTVTTICNDFEYPSLLPPPAQMWVEGFASRLHAQDIQKYETPIQVLQTWRLDQAYWNCIARYHPTALDAISKEAPVRAPAEHHNSEARALCALFAVNKLIPHLVPSAAKLISSWVESVGLKANIMADDDAYKALDANNFSPRVVGSVVAAEMIRDMQNDGWNYNGALGRDGKSCTVNCQPFTDTTGFVPTNSPWDQLADDKAWQPLLESDGRGFNYAQEHVTAHIGFKVKPVTITQHEYNSSQRSLADPNHNYADEVQKVLHRVANLTERQKVAIDFFDNKINVAGGMIMRLRQKYSLSFEAQVLYHYAYTSAEHDAVLLAWKEKINHNLIRPTSRIQALNDTVYSWSAPGGHQAKDWVSYIRVMPHAEYPSGSGCICTVVMEVVDSFLNDLYGDTSISTMWEFPAGSSRIEPGIVPGMDVTLSFKTMTELRNMCGQSRLDGGMHFTKSVSDSYTLCAGVGDAAWILSKTLLGGVSIDDVKNFVENVGTPFTATP